MTDKIHVYIEREVLFKRSLTMSVKVIVPVEYGALELGTILETAIDKAQEWKAQDFKEG